MTGESDVPETRSPIVLIDQWEDGAIEERAWVEVTKDTQSAESALRMIEDLYPVEDRYEEETYAASGATEHLKAMGDFSSSGLDEVQWELCEPGPGAVEFWVVNVVCMV
jgi:hypothetical protein